MDPSPFTPERVTVSLRLPIASAAPAMPIVKIGDKVRAGQLIADIPEGKLSARVHAPIDGVVTEIAEGRHILIVKR